MIVPKSARRPRNSTTLSLLLTRFLSTWLLVDGGPRVGLRGQLDEPLGGGRASSDRSVGRITLTFANRSPVGGSPAFGLSRGMPWPLSRKVRPGCVPAGIFRLDPTLERADGDLRAEQRLAERDRDLAGQIGADPRVDGVRLDPGHQVEIGRMVWVAAAATLQPDPAAGLDAPRDLDLEALAVDLDQPARAVERLLEGDSTSASTLGDRAAVGPRPGEPEGRRPAPEPSRRGPSRPGCPRTTTRQPIRRSAVDRSSRPLRRRLR